jgi:signal transduction histidine kinase
MRARLAAWLLAGVTVAAALAATAVDAGLEHQQDGWRAQLALLVGLSFVAGLGLLVVVRAGATRIGLLLLALAAQGGIDNLASRITNEVVVDRGEQSWWARVVVGVGQADWPAFLLVIVAIAILFPDGRPLTPRWRRVLLVSTAAAASTSFGIFAAPRFDDYHPAVPGPVGLPSPVALAFFIAGWPLVMASLPAAVVAVAVRYRRARGIERAQLKWLVFAIVLLPLLPLSYGIDQVLHAPVTYAVSTAVFPLLVACIPLAIAVALLRYRLYEIDWIVNRTLVYGAITALLAAVWLGLAFGLGVLAGGESAWVAAAATAVVAIAFGPVRRRIQDAVDRRFARARFEAVRRVQEYETAVREGHSRPEDVERVLREALGDDTASLALHLPESGELVTPDGAPAPEPPPGTAATPIVRGGKEIGIVRHTPALLERPVLVRAVLGAAALPVEVARLGVEVRRQLDEVERSRERIVRAGYDQRRRLERDLHDGAQQRLVGLGIRLRRIQRSLPGEARVLGPALDDAVSEVSRAIADLRTIAAGVRPPGLDAGLAAALADLARSVPLPVEVDVPGERLPDEIEAAAWFVACEAVTNAVKHAAPSVIRVGAARVDGAVRVVVADDGRGGAMPRPGSGLAGLADRVGAHGGTLHVESVPGAGTRVEAVIPCAS